MKYYRKPYGDDVTEIINYISNIRKDSGISIRKIATDIGVYPNTIQNWLNPSKNPSLDNVVYIGRYLGITFSMSNTRNPDCTDFQLIDCLAKAKDYQEITVRELAEMSGLTSSGVVNIFNHKVMPRLNTFLLLADALGVELEMNA